jgi:membrane associated rhomboid family serine protease
MLRNFAESSNLIAGMMGFERSDDYQPLLWVRGHPVHATLLLVVLHSLALIVCCVLQAFGVLPPIGSLQYLDLLGFSTDAAWHHGALWQFFTYGFCHNPSPWFLLDMFFLYIWGREVERYFGRKVFLLLYAGLWATGPILLSAFSAVTRFPNLYLSDSQFVDFGIFIAFVTVYPNVQFFFGLLAKWIAFAVLGIWTLGFLAHDSFPELVVLWGSVLVAFFGTRYASIGSGGFSVLGTIRDQLPQRTVVSGVKPRLKPRRALDTQSEPPSDVHDSIDPLLEKISRHGLASLTHGERATLEKARASLLRKERGT